MVEAFKPGVKLQVWVEGKCPAIAKIISHEAVTLISVDWLDGTYSDDMLPKDFVGLDPDEVEGMTKKCKLRASWDDGIIYNCLFMNTHKSYVYKVS